MHLCFPCIKNSRNHIELSLKLRRAVYRIDFRLVLSKIIISSENPINSMSCSKLCIKISTWLTSISPWNFARPCSWAISGHLWAKRQHIKGERRTFESGQAEVIHGAWISTKEILWVAEQNVWLKFWYFACTYVSCRWTLLCRLSCWLSTRTQLLAFWCRSDWDSSNVLPVLRRSIWTSAHVFSDFVVFSAASFSISFALEIGHLAESVTHPLRLCHRHFVMLSSERTRRFERWREREPAKGRERWRKDADKDRAIDKLYDI